jgi:hypothetical protein
VSLTFQATLFADGARGARMQEHRCVEHPRLRVLKQKQSHDAPWVTTFHIDGIANHFASLTEALKALEENPQLAFVPVVQTPQIAAETALRATGWAEEMGDE